jgi:hypothetical protein
LDSATGPTGESEFFQTPFVPYLPCAGIFINWFLVAQLEISGLLLLFLYVGVTLCAYFCFRTSSSIGNSLGWKRASYEALPSLEHDNDRWPALSREFSLPPVAHSATSKPDATVNDGVVNGT